GRVVDHTRDQERSIQVEIVLLDPGSVRLLHRIANNAFTWELLGQFKGSADEAYYAGPLPLCLAPNSLALERRLPTGLPGVGTLEYFGFPFVHLELVVLC